MTFIFIFSNIPSLPSFFACLLLCSTGCVCVCIGVVAAEMLQADIVEKVTEDHSSSREKEMVLGWNMHTMCLVVTEPDANDKFTADKDTYIASVLVRYRKTLIERTKYHLGYPYKLDFDYGALSRLQHFSINNLGSFIESNYGVESREFKSAFLIGLLRCGRLRRMSIGDTSPIVVRKEIFMEF